MLVMALVMPGASPAQAASAEAPSRLASPPAQEQDTPLVGSTLPSDEPFSDPLAGNGVAPTVYTPTLPLVLDLQVDRLLMAPDETATLTVTVYSQRETTVAGGVVTLLLPTGLRSAEGVSGEVSWPLGGLTPSPAGLSSWIHRMSLQADLTTLGVEQATFTLEARVQLPGYEALTTTRLLGIVPEAIVTESGRRATGTSSVQSTAGTVLHDVAHGVTLLVPAGAAPRCALCLSTALPGG